MLAFKPNRTPIDRPYTHHGLSVEVVLNVVHRHPPCKKSNLCFHSSTILSFYGTKIAAPSLPFTGIILKQRLKRLNRRNRKPKLFFGAFAGKG